MDDDIQTCPFDPREGQYKCPIRIVTPSATVESVGSPSIVIVTLATLSTDLPRTTGLEKLGTSSSSSILGDTPLPPTLTSTTSFLNPTSEKQTSQKTSNNGLTTGAKAGIGIGVVLGLVLVAIAAFLLGLRYRRRRGPKSVHGGPGVVEYKAELDGRGIGDRWKDKHIEVEALPPELPAEDFTPELAGRESIRRARPASSTSSKSTSTDIVETTRESNLDGNVERRTDNRSGVQPPQTQSANLEDSALTENPWR